GVLGARLDLDVLDQAVVDVGDFGVAILRGAHLDLRLVLQLLPGDPAHHLPMPVELVARLVAALLLEVLVPLVSGDERELHVLLDLAALLGVEREGVAGARAHGGREVVTASRLLAGVRLCHCHPAIRSARRPRPPEVNWVSKLRVGAMKATGTGSEKVSATASHPSGLGMPRARMCSFFSS